MLLESSMVMRRLFKIAVFWLITWAIANSISIIVEIYFLCMGKWKKAFENFYDVFCLYGLKAIIKREFPHRIESFSYFWDYTLSPILFYYLSDSYYRLAIMALVETSNANKGIRAGNGKHVWESSFLRYNNI